MRIPPVAAFAICVLIWGASWLAIRATTAEAGPLATATMRTLLAATLSLLLALALVRQRPSRRQLGAMLLTGLVLVGVNYGLVYWATPRIPSSLAALLYATVPLQAMLLSPSQAGHTWLQRTGPPVLALAGTAFAFDPTGSGVDQAWVPALVIVLAATTSAIGTRLAARHREAHPLWTNAVANAAGAALLLPVTLATEDAPWLPTSSTAWAGFLYMLIGGSLVAFLLYYTLLRTWQPHQMAYTTVATPFVSITLAALVEGETITAATIMGAMLVAAAVVWATRPPPAQPSSRTQGSDPTSPTSSLD